MRLLLLLPLFVALLAGCASTGPTPTAHTVDQWHHVPLPGKRATTYVTSVKEGRRATLATADNSASLWRLKVDVPPSELKGIELSWWVDSLVPGASLGAPGRTDAPASVMLAFEGDVDRLPARTRAMFELARAVTGEAPPYATLVYAFDGAAPVDSVVVNHRTDRVRILVLDSGPEHVRRWRDHRRDIAADFQRVFGEAPGRLVGVALMTDADNTQSSVKAWYGTVRLER